MLLPGLEKFGGGRRARTISSQRHQNIRIKMGDAQAPRDLAQASDETQGFIVQSENGQIVGTTAEVVRSAEQALERMRSAVAFAMARYR